MIRPRRIADLSFVAGGPLRRVAAGERIGDVERGAGAARARRSGSAVPGKRCGNFCIGPFRFSLEWMHSSPRGRAKRPSAKSASGREPASGKETSGTGDEGALESLAEPSVHPFVARPTPTQPLGRLRRPMRTRLRVTLFSRRERRSRASSGERRQSKRRAQAEQSGIGWPARRGAPVPRPVRPLVHQHASFGT